MKGMIMWFALIFAVGLFLSFVLESFDFEWHLMVMAILTLVFSSKEFYDGEKRLMNGLMCVGAFLYISLTFFYPISQWHLFDKTGYVAKAQTQQPDSVGIGAEGTIIIGHVNNESRIKVFVTISGDSLKWRVLDAGERVFSSVKIEESRDENFLKAMNVFLIVSDQELFACCYSGLLIKSPMEMEGEITCPSIK